MYGIARASVLLVPIAAALLCGQAGAQSAAPAEPTATGQKPDEIVVRGRRMSDVRDELQKYVNEFVVKVAKPPAGRGFARFRHEVCVSVTNLKTDAAQYLVNRISEAAADVGLEPGEPGCTPQVVVILTTDGAAMASHMVENDPEVFRPYGRVAGVNLDRAALDDFAHSDRAVRWWHVSLPVDVRTGMTAIRTAKDAGGDHEAALGRGAPVVQVSGPSRIHGGIVDNLLYVLIIVDSRKLTGTTWQQLGDYLAVVALAQIDPAANPAEFDSILNVFSNPAAYSGLTDWDRSYLKALYSFDQERIPRAQVNTLVGTMVRNELAPLEANE